MTRDEVLEELNCSVTELAKMLGVKSQVVSMWKKTGVPLARQYQIHDLLAGREPILDNRTQQKSPS